MARILVLTKRQYTKRDLLDDRFGRLRELPFELGMRNHEVCGLCLSYQKRKEGIIQDGPVQWESLNAGAMKITGLLHFIMRASARAAQADVIWACSDSFYGIMGYWLSRKHGIPLVFDLYDNFEHFLAARIPVLKHLYREVLRKCDAVTCVSHPLANLVTSYGRKTGISVVENAVQRELFRPMSKEKCRASMGLPQHVRLVGTAGALEKSRGISALLKAFGMLGRYPDVHLALAGPRDLVIPREENIHDLGILPYDKVPVFLNALDVAVVCLRNDRFGRYCFPQKAREIMACNVPIIAARVGSMEALLKDHPSWLFEPEDSGDLIRALENRFRDQRTGYSTVPTWADLAGDLEAIILETLKS